MSLRRFFCPAGFRGGRQVKNKTTAGAAVALAATGALSAAHAEESTDILAALAHTRPLVDIRLRYEEVEQTGIVANAHAETLRARVGLQTGAFLETQLLVEG